MHNKKKVRTDNRTVRFIVCGGCVRDQQAYYNDHAAVDPVNPLRLGSALAGVIRACRFSSEEMSLL
jgi:hypothetical protein